MLSPRLSSEGLRVRTNFADRLIDAVQRKGTPAVVNLDPVYARLPTVLKSKTGGEGADAELEAIVRFCTDVIRVVAPLVPAVKVNSAYFERYCGKGIDAYHAVIRAAAERNLLVIGDVKRGDVGHSAEQYALAHLTDRIDRNAGRRTAPDAVTINGYFGLDGVRPFIDAGTRVGGGVFVLVRTSNSSAETIQDVVGRDGRKLHEIVASLVAEWAADPRTIGRCGYSCVGAVVASRNPSDAAVLRERMPASIFLVPGYGAQGGTVDDVRAYFKSDGTGAVVAAGRSVIYAYERTQDGEAGTSDWRACVEQACNAFVDELRRVAGGP